MTLTADTITQPSLVRLYLRIGTDRVDVMLYNPYEDNSLVSSVLPLNTNEDDDPGIVTSLENVVYDNPLLLNNEFASATVTIDSRYIALIPDEAGDVDKIFDRIYEGTDMRLSHIVATTGYEGITLVSGIESRLLNFVRRTWVNARICHPLESLITFTRHKAADGSLRMLVDIERDATFVVTLSSSQLLQANRYDGVTVDDTVYYILSALQTFDRPVDEIIVTGLTDERARLIDMLRRFHPYVMPVIFPSLMHRAGAKGGTIPWDLLIMPITKQ